MSASTPGRPGHSAKKARDDRARGPETRAHDDDGAGGFESTDRMDWRLERQLRGEHG